MDFSNVSFPQKTIHFPKGSILREYPTPSVFSSAVMESSQESSPFSMESAGPCQDPAPGWASHRIHHGISGISTPAPWNNLQSRSFPRFPLRNSSCATIWFFQFHSNSRGVATVPDGIGRTRIPTESSPGASQYLAMQTQSRWKNTGMGWKKNETGVEKHRDEVGKTWNEGGKSIGMRGKNIGMGWKNLKMRQKSNKIRAKSRDGAENQRDEQEKS